MEAKRRNAYILFAICFIFFASNYILELYMFRILGKKEDYFFLNSFFNKYIFQIFFISIILTFLMFFKLKYIKHYYLRIFIGFILLFTVTWNGCSAAISTWSLDDSKIEDWNGF